MSLFWYKRPYDLEGTSKEFMNKMRKNMLFQYENCEKYRRILEHKGWTVDKINSLENIADIPFLPTLYFKHHRMDSVASKKMLVRATSSGTSGNKSDIGFDIKSLWNALGMSLTMGRRHKLISLRPCHYIVLGYQYRGKKAVEEKVVAKTAFAFTFLAPAKSRIYALKYDGKVGDYTLNLEEIKQALIKYSKERTPVRIMGFPFHAYWLLTQLKEEGIICHLPKGSVIAFGGGWKQYYTERADKETMYKLIEEVLGIPGENVWEFFGAVEHPIMYTTCKHHHFHVPIYSRVVLRDVDTLEPINEYGQVGLVNLLTPMINSAPMLSVMTDDLGIFHDGKSCGCGIDTPYLEILGRVGMEDITTCAAGAEQLSTKLIAEVMEVAGK